MTLLEFGINLQTITAGMAGGLMFALLMRRGDPAGSVNAVVVGAVLANYASELGRHFIVQYVPETIATPGFCAFAVGACGMPAAKFAIEFVQSKFAKTGKAENGA